MGAQQRSGVNLAVLFCITLLGTIFACAVDRRVAAPAPDGQHRVGTLWLRLVDKNRAEPYLGNGTARELMVRVWYPTSPATPCHTAPYASARVWAYLSQLAGVSLPEVITNSCVNAPVGAGAYPVIIATHGYTGTFTDYTFLFEELASRGYVVASIAHTYETTAVEFPDGRMVTSVVGSYISSNLKADLTSVAGARLVRLADLRFVRAELIRLNAESDGPFAGKLDLSRVGLIGHSLGGEVALSAIEQLPGFKAAVLLDGEVSNLSVVGSSKAIFILAAGRERWSENECKLWGNLRGPRLAVNLRGGNHFTPTDAIWLFKDAPWFAMHTGKNSGEKVTAAMRDYMAAFFDTSLVGNPKRSILNGAPLAFGNAVVTKQSDQLCSNHSTLFSGGLR